MKKNSSLLSDFKSSFVVTLVAIPLCLGIALASGAPLSAGIIAGIVGGIIVGLFGGTELSVAGPAAGLTVIVAQGISSVGGFEAFCAAVMLAGILQIFFGFLKAGKLASFFPSSVIEGMLAGIGIIIVIKQIPNALGYNAEKVIDPTIYVAQSEGILNQIIFFIQHLSMGGVIIGLVSLGSILAWDNMAKKKFKWANLFPGALIAVILSIMINELLLAQFNLSLPTNLLVQIPTEGLFHTPKMFETQLFTNPQFWKYAFTIAIVASIETLLSVEATDKLDPQKRFSNKNKELKAQGLGNFVSGLLGGLPLTAVVVRSSANIDSGAQSRLSTILHGVFILLAVLLIPGPINKIPLATLAIVLILVGTKLAAPKKIKHIWSKGFDHFIPFSITILVMVTTDLLMGIAVGLTCGFIAVIIRSYHASVHFHADEDKKRYSIKFEKDVTFLNKEEITNILKKIPDNASVEFDGSRRIYVDEDIVDVIKDFEKQAKFRNIHIHFAKSNQALHKLFKI